MPLSKSVISTRLRQSVAHAQCDVGKWINKGLGNTGNCKKPSACTQTEVCAAYSEFFIVLAEFKFQFWRLVTSSCEERNADIKYTPHKREKVNLVDKYLKRKIVSYKNGSYQPIALFPVTRKKKKTSNTQVILDVGTKLGK